MFIMELNLGIQFQLQFVFVLITSKTKCTTFGECHRRDPTQSRSDSYDGLALRPLTSFANML